MDMYPSGSVEILKLESKDFNLQVFADDLDKLTKNRKINQNVPAFVKVNKPEENIDLYTLTDYGDLVKNNGIHMLPVFFENGKYDITIKLEEDVENLTFIQNGLNISSYFKEVENIYFGTLNFKSDVGYTNLDIYNGSKKILSLIIEIFPSKMDYKKDYEEMILEINEEIASIAFTLLNKTYLEGSLIDTHNQTKTEFINILDYIFNNFIKSLDYIVHNFKHNIIEEERVVSINKAKRLSKRTRSYVRTKPHLLLERKDGFIKIGDKSYLPEKVVELRKRTTINIFENQFVKYIIKDTIKRIENLERILTETRGVSNLSATYSKYQLSTKKKKLNTYLRKYFKDIEDVVPKNTMTLVFKMSPGYKELYKKYRILSKGLDLGDDLFKISPKKIYQIYEMWCYIKLHKILYDLGYEVKQYGILDYRDNGLYLTLNTKKEASMIYEKNNQSIRLWYNKNYFAPTTIQKPDTVLHIENLNSKQRRTYIFDAKYRVKIGENGVEEPLEEDINVMHRYRDAIVSEMENSFKYKYEAFGAYVMFPCSNEKEYMNHKFYKSIENVNIGALPMLPGSTSLITQHLNKLLTQSDLEAKESRVAIDEFDDYAKFKREDVMVVNVFDREHLSAYLNHKFYHIPKKQLSNIRLGIKYIAFYQPKTNFQEEAGIYYYGEIDEVYTYKRSECKELPKSSRMEEEYLRFELKNIKRVSKIEAYEFGPVTLIYTTLYLLNNAENTRELKVKSNLEMKVYKLLRSISKRKDLYLKKEVNSKENIEEYKLGDERIEIINGKYIRLNGSKIDYRDLIYLI